MLPAREEERYQRQMQLKEIGRTGQERLKKAKILCVGSGGLGSPLCLYLASAGIGTLGIIDGDRVALNNLHRQVLFTDADCGRLKTLQAKKRLKTLNPHCNIQLHNEYLTENNALSIIQPYDFVADCSDNFATRYLVNDACCELKKENVFASIQQFRGYCTVFSGKHGPCYRCLFETMPPDGTIPTCAQAGVIGTIPGILGTFQANEIIKLILNIGTPLINRILILDALNGTTKSMQLDPSPDCLICSKGYSFNSLTRDKFTNKPSDHLATYAILPEDFYEILTQKEPFLLIDVRDQKEFNQGHLDKALSIPLNQMSISVNKLINKNDKIILYCQSDQRSRQACTLLRSAGGKKIFFIKGGLNSLRTGHQIT